MTEFSTYKDPRDGEQYKVLKLNDGNIWFAENLRYNANASLLADGKSGRYYSGANIDKVAPQGWRIPTPKDWKKLFSAYSNSVQRLNEAGLNFIPGGDMEPSGQTFNRDEICFLTPSYRRSGLLMREDKNSLLRVKFHGGLNVFSENPSQLAQVRCFKKA